MEKSKQNVKYEKKKYVFIAPAACDGIFLGFDPSGRPFTSFAMQNGCFKSLTYCIAQG